MSGTGQEMWFPSALLRHYAQGGRSDPENGAQLEGRSGYKDGPIKSRSEDWVNTKKEVHQWTQVKQGLSVPNPDSGYSF